MYRPLNLAMIDRSGTDTGIATWIVNSVRARLDRLRAWLQKVQADIVCLQELKSCRSC